MELELARDNLFAARVDAGLVSPNLQVEIQAIAAR